jgi:hypothetical protein
MCDCRSQPTANKKKFCLHEIWLSNPPFPNQQKIDWTDDRSEGRAHGRERRNMGCTWWKGVLATDSLDSHCPTFWVYLFSIKAVRILLPVNLNTEWAILSLHARPGHILLVYFFSISSPWAEPTTQSTYFSSRAHKGSWVHNNLWTHPPTTTQVATKTSIHQVLIKCPNGKNKSSLLLLLLLLLESQSLFGF